MFLLGNWLGVGLSSLCVPCFVFSSSACPSLLKQLFYLFILTPEFSCFYSPFPHPIWEGVVEQLCAPSLPTRINPQHGPVTGLHANPVAIVVSVSCGLVVKTLEVSC